MDMARLNPYFSLNLFKKNTDDCTLCLQEPEHIVNLGWSCPASQTIWSQINYIMNLALDDKELDNFNIS